jgi:hypothetical protein
MISWAVYFSSLELIQIKGNGGLKGFFDFWNIVDITRICLIILFVINEYYEEEERALVIYVVLIILSWLGLMELLRVFNMF